MTPYRMFTPASFGQPQQQQQQPQMPQLNLQPQLMPWPKEGGGPNTGEAMMGGISQLYQAMSQQKAAMGGAGGRLSGQVNSLLSSLQG